MESVMVYAYVTAVGFVMAGVLSSFVQLVSGQPMRFGVEPRSALTSILGILLRVFAGPAILMRNAWWGMLIEARPKSWFEKKGAGLWGETGSRKGPVGSGMGGG
jgi:hypothetical protein